MGRHTHTAKVVKLAASGGIFLSIGQIAAELEETRDVTRSLLAKAGISPAKRRGRTPLYRLQDLFRWLRRPPPPEPTPIEPRIDDKFYSAQLKKLQLERELGEVVRKEDSTAEFLALTKKLASWADALPDQLERAAGLTPAQVEQLMRRIDELRGDLHAELSK